MSTVVPPRMGRPRGWSPGTFRGWCPPSCPGPGLTWVVPPVVLMGKGGWRPAWAEVDLAAIRHNAALLAGLAGPAALSAVVKADGYGHGSVDVARAAVDGGATWLAVALVEEGVVLREAG